jgi:hyperosmotically inducible periplasmic protein
MNVKFTVGTALLLPVALALGGCGRDEPETTVRAPDTTTSTTTTTAPTINVPPAVEQRAEQAGAVMDDASITAKVKTALIADPELSGLAIDVDTSANVVTLNGNVASDAARAQAERITKGVEGVKEVKNNLLVKAS